MDFEAPFFEMSRKLVSDTPRNGNGDAHGILTMIYTQSHNLISRSHTHDSPPSDVNIHQIHGQSNKNVDPLCGIYFIT